MAPTPTPNMPIQNISATLTAQQLTDLKADIEALAPQFPVLVTLSEAERKALPRVGAGRETFCETAFNGAGAFPSVVPVFLTVAEWAKDETYFDQLAQVEVVLSAVLGKVLDTKQAVGAERYRQARKFYEAVKAAREDVPGLQSLYETLKEQFDGQGGTGEEEEPPAGGGEGGNPPA